MGENSKTGKEQRGTNHSRNPPGNPQALYVQGNESKIKKQPERAD